MDPSSVAQALASGGAYTAWFLVVVLAGTVGFLFRELQKAYREDGKETAAALLKVNEAQIQQTLSMNMILEMFKAFFARGGGG